MAVFKTLPEIRCRIQAQTGIPTGGTGGFTVACILGETIGTAGGTSSGAVSGLPLLNPLKSRSWNEPTQVKRIGESLEFVRFSKDGRVRFGASAEDAGGEDEITGFCLRQVETPLDARSGVDGVNSELLAGIDVVLWTATQGLWRGVQSGSEGQARGLVNIGAAGSSKAQSGILTANQGTRWTITGQAKPGSNGLKVMYLAIADNLFRVALEHGKPLRFQERIGSGWAEAMPLKGAPNIDLTSGATTIVRFVRLCGRLLIGCQGFWWWFAKYKTPEDTQERDPRALQDVAWPAGRCSVESIGVNCNVNLATIDFDTQAAEAERQIVIDAGALNYADQGDGEMGIASGWLKYGAARVAITSTENRGTLTLTVDGSTDGNDSPLINKVTGKFPDSPFSAGSGNWFDASHAVRSASLELAMPPFQIGSNMQITFDRMHLDRLGTEAGVEWGNFFDQFSVVTWESRWHYSNGTTGNWTAFFKGIAPKIDTGTGSVNERHLTLNCFSPVYLLTAPAAFIDHSFPPLDAFWLYKLRQSNNQTATGSGPYNPYDPPPVGNLPQNVQRLGYYCVDAVRDIYYLFYAADASRVHDDTGGTTTPLLTSDSDPLGYCRANQVATGDGQPPTVNGWMLELQQGSDAASEMQRICGTVNAFVYEGYLRLDDFTDWARPIVSTLERYYANRPTHIIADTIFDGLSTDVITAWVNHVAESIERETRPDVTINHVISTSSGFFGDSADGSGFPARIAEAYLASSDFNSEKKIRHRRTFSTDVGPLGGFPGGVEAHALTLINELAINKEYAWPTSRMEGRCSSSTHNDKPIVNGDLVQFKVGTSIESDSGLNLDTQKFRADAIRHEWTELGGTNPDHMMEVGSRPISGSGL